MPKVFIAHSSLDKVRAEALVLVLRSALNLAGADIRCTSVEGHGLPGGANTNDELRQEVMTSPVFIGLLSRSSFTSPWVLFELGARWGATDHLIPLLLPGFKPSDLRGPITAYNALTCTVADLHQLVREIGVKLGVAAEGADVYQKHLDALLDTCASDATLPEPVAAPSGGMTGKSRRSERLPPATESLVRILSEAENRRVQPTDDELSTWTGLPLTKMRLLLEALEVSGYAKGYEDMARDGRKYSITQKGRKYLLEFELL